MKDCFSSQDEGKIYAVQAFLEQARKTKRAIQDAKNAHWKMLERHRELMNACVTPEELDEAMQMLASQLTN